MSVKDTLAAGVVAIPWLLLAVGAVVFLALPWWLLATAGSWVPVGAVYGGLALGAAYWWAVDHLEASR